MKMIVFFLFLTLALARYSFAEECNYTYWEVIPSDSNCKILHLPDFDFQKVPQPADAPNHIKRFCTSYEITSGKAKQLTSYCYTGEGDSTGPAFTAHGKKYLADVGFQGCVDGKLSKGTVFVEESWHLAPKSIKRLWPVEMLPQKPSCTSAQ